MLAPRDVHSPGQQTVALASTLFESVDYHEEHGSEEHAREYNVSAIGLSSAGVGALAFDDIKPEVQPTPDVDNSAVCLKCLRVETVALVG